MTHALLQWLVCPACHEPLTLIDARTGDGSAEIAAGTLRCERCGGAFPIVDGVPNLLPDTLDSTSRRTAESFGFIWARSTHEVVREGLHLRMTLAALDVEAPGGLILDAGCGGRSDTVALAARAGATVIGVDVSEGGTASARARTRRLPNAHIGCSMQAA